MKKIILGLILLTGVFAQAEVSYSMPALEVGFKWNSMDFEPSASSKQSSALQLGGSMVFNFHEQMGLRTGLFYSERTFKSDLTDGKLTYAEIPLHFMFKFEDYAGVYLGPSLSNKLGDECNCGGGSLQNIKSFIMPITFGAQFKFTPNLGLNLFYETIPSDLATGIKNSRGIGLNVLLAFD